MSKNKIDRSSNRQIVIDSSNFRVSDDGKSSMVSESSKQAAPTASHRISPGVFFIAPQGIGMGCQRAEYLQGHALYIIFFTPLLALLGSLLLVQQKHNLFVKVKKLL
mmetsp:Transcript_8240/g.8431  ORF Transcript_8240/g.8431 Transcript_8240/m.8431 type:complete len:107 (-) Transcript_8240:49-369(-)